MKSLILVSLFLSSYFSIKAQGHYLDSLQKVLKETTEDTTRVFILLWISVDYYYSKPDIAMRYAQQAYHIAEDIQFTYGKAQSLAIIGNLNLDQGYHVKALEIQLKVLELHEKSKDTSQIAACYNNMAMIYQEQEDYPNAVHYYFRAKNILETNENEDLVKAFINIGYNYERMNRLDSALLYLNKAYELGIRIKDNKDIAVVHINLGNVHYRLHNNDLALSHYRSSIPLAHQPKDDKQTLAHANYGIAKLFKERNKIDSSMLFAKQSLAFSNGSYRKGVAMASALLSELYEVQHKTDSALMYYKKAVKTRDSMFNPDIVRKVQILNTKEQLRLQQEKREAFQRYRSNLKMCALIGGFIILLLVAAFLFRVRQLKRENLIRTKLSKDVHDDLGSTLNSIKVYTNLALIKNEKQHLQKIKESAQEAISGVRDIMWVLDDRKDNVADLLTRIRQFAIPLCEANDIRYVQQVNDEALHQRLQQEEKRNLYLIIKEAINNTIKYAKTNEVYLTMELSNKRKLLIQIKDTGTGFNPNQASEGNGLRNMKFRAEQLGYNFSMDSLIDQGTIIELKKN